MYFLSSGVKGLNDQKKLSKHFDLNTTELECQGY